MNEVGAQIRAVRGAARLTQAEVAERAGVSQPHLSEIETGQRGVGIEVLNRLAGALRATWGYDGERIVFRRRRT